MSDRPTAAPPYFPYDHPNLAVVWRREALREFMRLPAQLRRGRTVEQFMRGKHDRT